MSVHLDIDLAAATPPYAQLVDQVEASIARSELPPGHRLPTVRQLARDVGLATNTVARAYRELEAAGLIEMRGRHGTFVAAHATARETGDDRLARAAARFAADVDGLGLDDRAVVDAVRRAVAATRAGQSPTRPGGSGGVTS